MVTRRRNAALAGRISELGLTEHEVADLLNERIRQATGTPGRCTPRYVRLLIDGAVRWPWALRRIALEQVLGVPVLELGFIPWNSNGGRPSPRPPAATASPPAAGPGADLVAVVGGRPVQVEVPVLPTQPLTDADLNRLGRPLTELYDACAAYGPVGLAPAAARQATRLAELHVEMSVRFRRRLHALVADYWAAAARFALDAGNPASTDLHLQRALWSATAGADPLVGAHITHIMASRAEHHGAHAEAAALAYAATHSPAAKTDSRARAVGYLHLALAQAAHGGLPRAERSLHRAGQALRHARPGPARPWLSGIGEATVHAYRARAALRIGSYDIAAKHAQQAASTAEPGRTWDHTIVQLDLAEAYLGMREVEQAVQQADIALGLAQQMNQALRAGVVAVRLRQLARRLAHWPEVQPAPQWVARYRAVAANPASACLAP